MKNMMLENLKKKTMEAEALAQENREKAEPFLWTEAELVLPLFDLFMANNKSIFRFVKMFDSDPEYYLEQARKKCYFFDKLNFELEIGTPDDWLEPIKAFACHFSDRPGDITQLEKFYKKQMTLVLNHFPTNIPDDVSVDLQDEVAHYLMFSKQMMKDEDNNPKVHDIYIVGLSVLAIYTHKNHPVRIAIGGPIDSIVYEHMMMAYYFRTGTVPPEIVKSTSMDKLTDRMVSRLSTRRETLPVRLTNLWKASSFGSEPYFEKAKEEFRKISLSHDKNVSDSDWEKISRNMEMMGNMTHTYRDTLLFFIHSYLDHMAQNKAGDKSESQALPQIEKKAQPAGKDILVQAELSEKLLQLDQANAKVSNLQELLNREKDVTKDLKNQVSSLSDELMALREEFQDVNDLLDHLSDSDDEFEMENTELTKEEKEIIAAAKIIVVGGHCHLQKFLREMFPNVRFIDAEPGPVEPNLIRSADLVCYLPHHLSHSMFQKVKNIATISNIKQVYHRTNNVVFIYKTIAKGLLDS